MNTKQLDYKEFLSRIESLREKSGFDLHLTEDLSLAVMNLISMEEHFFFTAEKTGKQEYFDVMQNIRELRKTLLAELMPQHEGETWCAAKHLLGATMRLIEVGTKLQSEHDMQKAQEMFHRAYTVYSLFWALKLRLVDVKKVKTATPETSKIEDLVTQLADCCKE